MRLFTLLLFSLLYVAAAKGQIVAIDPPLFTIDEEITIIYDASLGSGGLVGVTPVYAHTGIITVSGGPGAWQNVQGNWGTADPNVVMAPIGNNMHLIQFVPREFYGIDQGVEVLQFAFVFRNADGSKEGKTSALGDIFVDVPNIDEFAGKFITPDEEQLVLEQGEQLEIKAAISMEGNYTLYDNNVEIFTSSGTTFDYTYTATEPGNHSIRFEATDGMDTIGDKFSIAVLDEDLAQADTPVQVNYGASVVSDGSIILKLHAPNKEHVFALTNLTDFQIDTDYQMQKTVNGEDWWIQIPQSSNNTELLYQYLVDGTIKIADPYSTLILDNVNDSGIDPALNSVPEPYPVALTSGHISYVNLSPTDYDWQHTDYDLPATEDLVIYEILLRDFLADNSFDSLIDTLSYLSNLGINAIELMPVSEFENNDSWGYNPSYHMALDKYYGNPETFKKFVDAAHGLGMVVLLDIVYNHAFGQSPLVRLYWDSANSRPSEDSPYFNPIARHPFNVGFDFNHDELATQIYTKQTIDYWLDEYRVDGFRFDLSKGFTQRMSTNDGVFAAYDAERIARLTDYGEHIWQRFPESILILEHFAMNSEEKELSDKGFLLWGNANYNSNEASMGWNDGTKSDFSHVFYEQRGFNDPHIIGYMESHDEERLMYKNLNFGNSAGNYNVQNLSTGLRRNAMTTAFFMSIPGPKLMWQFGELGYDFSINTCTDGSVNDNCRLARKPIKWDYLENAERKSLFELYQQIFRLKHAHPAIDADADLSLRLTGETKSIVSSKDDEHIFIIGNFGVTPNDISVDVPYSGIWHDYLLGTTITTNDTYSTTLMPGEFHVYVSDESFVSSVTDTDNSDLPIIVYPNPTIDQLNIVIDITSQFDVYLYNSRGQLMLSQTQLTSNDMIDVSALDGGVYVIHVVSELLTIGTTEVLIQR